VSEKGHKAPFGEARLSEKRGFVWLSKRWSGSCQPQEDGKGFWNAKEPDGDPTCWWDTCVASQPLGPVQARMDTLRTRQKRRRGASGRHLVTLHHSLLLSKQVHAGPTMPSSAPIPKDAKELTRS